MHNGDGYKKGLDEQDNSDLKEERYLTFSTLNRSSGENLLKY